MRKIMLWAAMLAMVLAAAAPALGQAVAINEGDDVEYNAVCQNIIGGFGDITQAQYGTAEAIAADDSAAAAEVAQSQDVSISQVNECLNEVDLNGDGKVTVVEVKKFVVVTVTATATPTATVTAVAKKTVTATPTATVAAKAQYVVKKTVTATATPTATATATALPPTGGLATPGAVALGAGVLLVAGGLVARRLAR